MTFVNPFEKHESKSPVRDRILGRLWEHPASTSELASLGTPESGVRHMVDRLNSRVLARSNFRVVWTPGPAEKIWSLVRRVR